MRVKLRRISEKEEEEPMLWGCGKIWCSPERQKKGRRREVIRADMTSEKERAKEDDELTGSFTN